MARTAPLPHLPVPDPSTPINGNYTSKAALTTAAPVTLVHEMQHLINTERRLYVNGAVSETADVWLNEGLSSVAEKLLYYAASTNEARSNINFALTQSTPAQISAFNGYASGIFDRLGTYMLAPETTSPPPA